MLFGLLGLGILAVGIIRGDEENRRGTSITYGKTSKGYSTNMDGKGHTIINGEYTTRSFYKDSFGNEHVITRGVKSGKIYDDSFDRNIESTNKLADADMKKALDNGALIYDKWDYRFHKRMPNEISTGKIIVKIYHKKKNGMNFYRKFYLADDIHKVKEGYPAGHGLNYKYFESQKGDWGIPISQSEYSNIKLYHHGYDITGIPDDEYIWQKIGTEDDPYYNESIKIEAQRYKDIERKVRDDYDGQRFYVIGSEEYKTNSYEYMKPEDYGGNKEYKLIHIDPNRYYSPVIMMDGNGDFWDYEYMRYGYNANEFDNRNLEVDIHTIDQTFYQLAFHDVTEKFLEKEIHRRLTENKNN